MTNPTDNQLIKFLDSDVHIHEPLHPDMSQRQPRHVSNKGSECEDCGKWFDEMEWLDNGIGSGFYYSPANSITLTTDFMLRALGEKRISVTFDPMMSLPDESIEPVCTLSFIDEMKRPIKATALTHQEALRGAVVELYKQEKEKEDGY